MDFNEKVEIPHVDRPDEVSTTNRPEIEITTPHPSVPQPDAEEQSYSNAVTAVDLNTLDDEAASLAEPVGFLPPSND